MNRTWNEAVTVLADGVAIPKHKFDKATGEFVEDGIMVIPRDIRLGAVIKIYGRDLPIIKIADQAGYDVDTVSKYHGLIRRWLLGGPKTKHGDSVEGIEPAAWVKLETAFRAVGIVA
jgi:hypothetical protein